MDLSANGSKPKAKWSIPTRYGGIEFRSKLEAEWALFFDWLGIRWAYEVEGYDIDGVRYLPDFWLPDAKTIVEVKGVLDVLDERKLLSLANVSSRQGVAVVLAESPVGQSFGLVMPHPQHFDFLDDATALSEFRVDYETTLVRCARCGNWYFRYDEQSWQCTGCGFADGDSTYDEVFGSNPKGMQGYVGGRTIDDWLSTRQSWRY